MSDQERRKMLKELLGEENADIFYRYCVEGATAPELAAEYGMSDSSIRMRVNRIKKKILMNRQLFFAVVFLFVLRFGSLRP